MLKFRQFLIETEEGRFAHGMFHRLHDHVAHFENHPDRTTEHETQAQYFGQNDHIPVQHFSIEDMTSTNLLETAMPVKKGSKRQVIKADGAKGGPQAIVVSSKVLNGGINSSGGKFHGMIERNKMRAKVYGGENREPLKPTEIHKIASEHLEEHFSKSKDEQIKAEKAAMKRLQSAGHIAEGASGSTLTNSEKLDTIKQPEEKDRKNGMGFDAAAVKEVAGHALYTSGSGAHERHHIVNTCKWQTKGCGGGTDAKKVVDTSKGTCFAPKAEQQYTGAAIMRTAHSQMKHDPAMLRDYTLAHSHSIRRFARKNDNKTDTGKKNGNPTQLNTLIRPDTTSESDHGVTAHVVNHLNKQRLAENKPIIQTNGYGKRACNTIEHNPRLGNYRAYSNNGPKVKISPDGNGMRSSVSENAKVDQRRINETILSQTPDGKPKVDSDGHRIPNRGSYSVNNAKRGSKVANDYESHVTHIKYWSKGRTHDRLSDKEKAQDSEGHFDAKGNPTTPDKAHYGHRTVTNAQGVDERHDYQKQNILHPRKVPVGKNKDGSPKMIASDSRFQDEHFLPKKGSAKRYMSPNGIEAGHIVMTTPTESTSNDQHHSGLTHHIDENTIQHARENNGEHEIDRPEDQHSARGNEYEAPNSEPPVDMKKAIKKLGPSDGRGQPVVTRKSKGA